MTIFCQANNASLFHISKIGSTIFNLDSKIVRMEKIVAPTTLAKVCAIQSDRDRLMLDKMRDIITILLASIVAIQTKGKVSSLLTEAACM